MNAGRLLIVPTLVALAIGMFALSGPATAHDKAFDSKVTIREDPGKLFHGRVKSERAGCVPNRLVKLYRGNGTYTGTSDITNENGRWEINYGPGYNYYAKVTRRVRTPGDHRHVCRGDVSPTI
jgi:hypothetical protein